MNCPICRQEMERVESDEETVWYECPTHGIMGDREDEKTIDSDSLEADDDKEEP